MHIDALFNFWGKTKPEASSIQPSLAHPLVYHSLDVAAVSNQLLAAFPHRLEYLARLCRTKPEAIKALLVRLIALHDIGKFHPSFQIKQPDLCPEDLIAESKSGHGRHDALGFCMMEHFGIYDDFAPVLGSDNLRFFEDVCAAVAFHHGSPHTADFASAVKGARAVERHVALFREQIAELFPFEGEVQGPADETASGILSWSIAGLTVLSDWIGSNTKYFDYPQPKMSLAAYWAHAQAQAEKAVTAAGILPAKPAHLNAADSLLPKGREASSLQTVVFNLPLGEGPQLFIVEDVTGAGKTEAALMLASRLLGKGRATGLFFALPTMATANALYERMSAAYRTLFEAEPPPSLVLAHGRKALHEGFTSSILDMADSQDRQPGKNSDDETAEAMCAAWIADDRRKAFFAHVGAGTIDQALLGVLPSRHQALRLWGLADRVLIIDEAHSYDPYVNKEMQRLIEFHAALGGSTIVLSATLATDDKQALIDAFYKGVLLPTPPRITSRAYPLLTAVSREAVAEKPIDMRQGLPRKLKVRRLLTVEIALDHICAHFDKGAAVAWIRNTVDDAIEACEALEARGLSPLLLHARFAMGDRLDKEEEIRKVLGRDSQGEQRHRVIVGTQILEQSLDYDVDAMVIDLAPIDLMIQRAGRLWRHQRDHRPLPYPELMIVSPDPDEVHDKDWYAAMSRRATGVYQDTGVVWRSAKAVFDAGVIDTPGNIRDLIARVYDDDTPLVTPAYFDKATLEAEGKALGQMSVAEGNLLKLKDGYYRNNQLWMRDDRIPTRLENVPSTVFRLGRFDCGKIVPWMSGESYVRRAWALSEVSIAQQHVSGVAALSRDLEACVKEAKASWGKWEGDIPLLVLERNEDEAGREIWQGRAVTSKGEPALLLYDRRLGLRVAKNK